MSYTLKEYQQIVYDKILDSVKLGQKKVLVLGATGFGKTILAYKISENAIKKDNRVLFTNHRIALAKQTFKKFNTLNPELLQGENKIQDFNSNLIIASLQTLINSEIPEPKIIIIDEVHYGYEGDLVQSLFVKFPNSIFIGLSATPVDNKDCLLEGWDSIIDDYQTEDLIKLNELTPFKCFAPASINVSELKIKGSDFDEKDLLNIIEKENINQTIIDNYISLGENRLFICFGVNKKHCQDLKSLFDRASIKTEIIDANTSDNKRELYISQLKNKETQGLISIEILTAGFDEPQVSCVILATATAQWKKYVQCAGRGIRLFPNKKNCILLDFGGNIERHGLPDERKIFKFGKQISRVIDKQLKIDTLSDSKNKVVLTVEKEMYLKRIGSLLDLYDNKLYRLESDLQTDVNNFLKKTNFYFWRQNSGKVFIQGRWVSFASKSGLPDNTVFYKNSSIFFGIELKLPHGNLTDKQRETLPEFTENNILFFIAESVFDVYLAIEHMERNIKFIDNDLFVSSNIYNLPDRQKDLRNRLRIGQYATYN